MYSPMLLDDDPAARDKEARFGGKEVINLYLLLLYSSACHTELKACLSS